MSILQKTKGTATPKNKEAGKAKTAGQAGPQKFSPKGSKHPSTIEESKTPKKHLQTGTNKL